MSRRRSLWLPTAVAIALLSGAAGAAFAEEFLIVQRPERLRIFNRYQQQLSAEERARLRPFTPFRVIDADAVMGDGFTRCMTVDDGAHLYYIQKDEEGELFGASDAGFIKRIQRAEPLRDSVEVIASGGLTFFDPLEQVRSLLPRGAIVVRIFATDRLTYAYALSEHRYGWIRQPARGQAWRPLKRAQPDAVSPIARVMPALAERVEEVNGKLRRLFDHLGAKHNRQLPAPQWRMHSTPGAVLFVLETSLPAERFEESSRQLARKLESALLGTPLRVQASAGYIEVR
jgi:hypothetical protein